MKELLAGLFVATVAATHNIGIQPAGRSSSLPRAAVEATGSPYPASFDGSTWRYQLALFALISISIVAGRILWWMGREIVRGRHDSYPTEPLFAFRWIVFFASLATLMRCGPEATVMITWRENVEVAATVLVVKRWLDAITVFPSLAWMSLVVIFYPRICMEMVRIAARDPSFPPIAPKIPRDRLKQLATTLALTFTISILIAVGKRW